MFKRWPIVLIAAFLVVALSAIAHADDSSTNLLGKFFGQTETAPDKPALEQPTNADEIGDIIRLTSDKNMLLRLSQDAASVIVNNPTQLAVMLDSPRLMILMPRTPGATSLTVLDAKGQIILRKSVIISNVQTQYVRIRRMCSGDPDCRPSAYYYCPDGCYEISPTAPGSSGAIPPPPAVAVEKPAAAAPATPDASPAYGTPEPAPAVPAAQ